MSKLLAMLATVALLGGSLPTAVAAAGPGPAVDDPGGPALGQGPAHWFGPDGYGTWGESAPPPAGDVTPFVVDNLVNPLNGEIMPTTHTHLIFWLPAGFHYSGGTTAATDLDYENQITAYFNDVGGSQILNTTTQYPGNNGTPADTSNLASSVVDTTAYPHAGTAADPVTQSDLNTQVSTHATALGHERHVLHLPARPPHRLRPRTADGELQFERLLRLSHLWLLRPRHAGQRLHLGGHPGQPQRGRRSVAAANSTVTGNNSADTTLSSVEHEHLEAVTDPRLNAWQDSTGGAGENGDKCNRNMGVANALPTTANNFLGSGPTDVFRIQREWSNAAGRWRMCRELHDHRLARRIAGPDRR